jgi:hypothetical protein
MRQYLQVSTYAAIAGLETVGLVSDMGGGNDRFFTLLNDGQSISSNNVWPEKHVVSQSPVNPSINVHMWSCSTHGAKNIRGQLHKSRSDGTGTRKLLSKQGVPLGWWVFERLLVEEMERYEQGGAFWSDLTQQAVELDGYSAMDASLAKAPFTAKTIGAMMERCADYLARSTKKVRSNGKR